MPWSPIAHERPPWMRVRLPSPNGRFAELDALVRREGQNLDDNEGYMPPVGKGWSDAQLEALIAYVESNEKLAPPTDGGEGGG